MVKPKSGHRHKKKPAATPPSSQQRSKTRVTPGLVLIAIVCGAGVLVILSTRQKSITLQTPQAPAPQEASSAAAIDLTGLTVEEQVVTLRDAATKLAEDLAARFPNDAEAHVLLGDVHRRFGRSAEAMTCWEKASALNPRQASSYDRMAIVAMEKGQFAEALALWQKVLAVDPTSAGVHNKMGRVLLASGEQDAAIAALEEAVRLSPGSALTHYLLGQGHLQKKEYEQAVTSYKKALALDARLPNAHYGLATAYARLRQPALAKQYQASFKTLSAGNPEDRPYGFSAEEDLLRAREDYISYALRGATLLMAKGQRPATEAMLRQAVAVDPNHVACRKRLAAFYQRVDKLPKALAQCEYIAQLEPNDPTCQLLIGSLAIRMQQAPRAETAFRRITELAPDESVGYRELARLYVGLGQKASAARRLAEKAVALEPAASNYSLLGQACYQDGDTEAALAAMSKAMELDPRNSNYRQAYDLMKTRR